MIKSTRACRNQSLLDFFFLSFFFLPISSSPPYKYIISYGAPYVNRFWKILALLFNESLPYEYLDKTKFLKRHNIALWDVLHCAQREGSLDANISN